MRRSWVRSPSAPPDTLPETTRNTPETALRRGFFLSARPGTLRALSSLVMVPHGLQRMSKATARAGKALGKEEVRGWHWSRTAEKALSVLEKEVPCLRGVLPCL